MSVNKLDWITDATFLINLPDQLQATVSCGDVKFRTKTAATAAFSLYELFKFIENRAAKDNTFVTPDLLNALRTIKNKRDDALTIKALTLSPKWIYGLLVQLGRAIARLFTGCKTLNYDASLIKLCQQFNSKLPTGSTPAVSGSTFIDKGSPDLYIILAKMENNEPITIEDFKRVSQQLITLDLTKWKTPRQVVICNGTGTKHFEWITTLANEAKNLKKVILPDVQLDPSLFYWFVVDPENQNKQAPDYATRQPKTGFFSAFGQRASAIRFYRSDVDVEFPTPSLATIRPLNHEEKARLRDYFHKKNKLEELLVKNLPEATNKVATENLHAILGYARNYLPCLIKNIKHLFDTNLVMLPTWAKWLTYNSEEDMQKLYDGVSKGNEKETVLIPLIYGIRGAESLDSYRKNALINLQQNFLIKLLATAGDSNTFTYQVAEFLVVNHTKTNVVSKFNTDLEFGKFVDYFLNQTPNPERKTHRILSLLSQTYTDPVRRSLLIAKFPTWNFCPILHLNAMPRVLAADSNDLGLFTCIQNIYFAALSKILKDPQYVNQQQEEQQQLLQLITSYDTVMINHQVKGLTNHKLVLQELIVECAPSQVFVLMSALFTNYVNKAAERARNLDVIVKVIERLRDSYETEHAERIKAFFSAYWKIMNEFPQEMHDAMGQAIRRFESQADIAAFLSSADEAGLLQPHSTTAQLPYNVLPLHPTWFERLLADNYKYTHRNRKIGVSKEEIAELLYQYPEQCLRLPESTLEKIFPREDIKLREEVVRRANQYFLGLYQQLDLLPPDLRNMTLEYGGFDATQIANAKAYENLRKVASHQLPRTV